MTSREDMFDFDEQDLFKDILKSPTKVDIMRITKRE